MQVILPLEIAQLPWLMVKFETAVPSVTASVRTTSVAVAGPALDAFPLTTTLSPTRPDVGDAEPATETLAGSAAVIDNEAELFLESRSGCVPETVMESDDVPAVVGVTANLTVAEDGSGIVPRLQVIVVAPVQVPWLGCAETNFQPAGKFSVNVTAESCGPSFRIVAV